MQQTNAESNATNQCEQTQIRNQCRAGGLNQCRRAGARILERVKFCMSKGLPWARLGVFQKIVKHLLNKYDFKYEQNHRGLVYCKVCGARAGSNQIRLLGAQCSPPGTGGSAVLRAIGLGRKPPGVTE